MEKRAELCCNAVGKLWERKSFVELEILRWIQQSATPLLDHIYIFITMLGEQVPIVAVFTMIYWCFHKEMGEYMGFALFQSTCLNGLVKDIFQLKRPIGEPGIRSLRVETATGHSFPSGHTQTSSTFWGSMAFWSKKWWAWAGVAVLCPLIGLSRLYLGVHYPKDVAVGFLLGLGSAALSLWLFHRVPRQWLYWAGAGLSLLILPVAHSKDTIMACGLFCGFAVAYWVEQKWICFTVPSGIKRRLLRWLPGMVLVAMAYFLSSLLPLGSLTPWFTGFLTVFTGVAVYPWIFTRFGF